MYAAELDGKFKMHVAFSREPGEGRRYVQDLLVEEGGVVVDALVERKGGFSFAFFLFSPLFLSVLLLHRHVLFGFGEC